MGVLKQWLAVRLVIWEFEEFGPPGESMQAPRIYDVYEGHCEEAVEGGNNSPATFLKCVADALKRHEVETMTLEVLHHGAPDFDTTGQHTYFGSAKSERAQLVLAFPQGARKAQPCTVVSHQPVPVLDWCSWVLNDPWAFARDPEWEDSSWLGIRCLVNRKTGVHVYPEGEKCEKFVPSGVTFGSYPSNEGEEYRGCECGQPLGCHRDSVVKAAGINL